MPQKVRQEQLRKGLTSLLIFEPRYGRLLFEAIEIAEEPTGGRVKLFTPERRDVQFLGSVSAREAGNPSGYSAPESSGARSLVPPGKGRREKGAKGKYKVSFLKERSH